MAADRSGRQLLGVAEGTPLLLIERVAYTYGDRPVELRRSLYDTDARTTTAIRSSDLDRAIGTSRRSGCSQFVQNNAPASGPDSPVQSLETS